MGFLFGKKKSPAAPAADAVASSEAPPAKPSARGTGPHARGGATLRQSRRVVAAKPAAPKPAAVAAPAAPVDPDELTLDAPAIPAAKPVAPTVAAPAPNLAAVSSGRSGDAALADFLVGEAKLVAADVMQTARAKAQAEGLPLDAVLTADGLITEDAILGALSQARYFPHLQLDRYAIRKKALDTVTKEDAVRLSVMPVDKLGSLLQLAMVNPLDEEAVAFIHSRTGLEVKRCIATRAELQRGIDKWYGGQAQAQDASISFVAEPTQETKSLTQVLGNVSVAPATPVAAPVAIKADIAPEIQDIDDLLSAEEAIAPAIIEPIHLDEAPLIVPADEVVEGSGRAPSLALEPRGSSNLTLDDDSGVRDAPLDEVPITKPIARPAAPTAYVQLVPVLEDEFKYAITHSKAHVFEKWVGLQTRNRIINALPVDSALDPLLERVA